ncbi:hypothetical protein KUM39_16300 [Streptomyces sp. J2-1]|uniref:hypothetical protein n=1 Tax=Streptomyces corallincola TaxID=2851888 RepID=UPI001C38C886|nr:hypothetical protein [Streptomyces corallincola]MBV2355918.1 hypothetical protein [Streptomyces corallincola]
MPDRLAGAVGATHDLWPDSGRQCEVRVAAGLAWLCLPVPWLTWIDDRTGLRSRIAETLTPYIPEAVLDAP